MSGDELASINHTWPAILAHDLGITHHNHARAGVGNLYILEQLLTHTDDDSVVIVHWTWIDRFDFCSALSEKWETLRPSLDHPMAENYYKNLHGQYKDMLQSCIYISTAINFLKSRHVPFLMTFVDKLVLEPVQDCWHLSRPLNILQDAIRADLHDFQGQNFIEWSYDNGYEVSARLHPLARAHRAAADLWYPVLKQLSGTS